MVKNFITLYETKNFLRACHKFLGDDGHQELRRYLNKNPTAGDVIPGSAGIRKLRFARPGMGKRGGVRVIYYYVDTRGFLILLTLYAKSAQEDLTKHELKLWTQAAQQIKTEIEGESDDSKQ